jgi:hypothetical protein
MPFRASSKIGLWGRHRRQGSAGIPGDNAGCATIPSINYFALRQSGCGAVEGCGDDRGSPAPLSGGPRSESVRESRKHGSYRARGRRVLEPWGRGRALESRAPFLGGGRVYRSE